MSGIFTTAPGQRICLASASSRRKELLEAAGVDFFVQRTDWPERAPKAGESPQAYALATARAKATAAGSRLASRADFQPDRPTIIACDTIVCLQGRIFGKPKSREELLQVLNLLNGRQHQVYSAVSIIWPEASESGFVEETVVHFEHWPLAVLETYADGYQPYDKAGGYGIQDGGGFLVSRIEGSWTNVVGLPLSQLLRELLARGVVTSRALI